MLIRNVSLLYKHHRCLLYMLPPFQNDKGIQFLFSYDRNGLIYDYLIIDKIENIIIIFPPLRILIILYGKEDSRGSNPIKEAKN